MSERDIIVSAPLDGAISLCIGPGGPACDDGGNAVLSVVEAERVVAGLRAAISMHHRGRRVAEDAARLDRLNLGPGRTGTAAGLSSQRTGRAA